MSGSLVGLDSGYCSRCFFGLREFTNRERQRLGWREFFSQPSRATAGKMDRVPLAVQKPQEWYVSLGPIAFGAGWRAILPMVLAACGSRCDVVEAARTATAVDARVVEEHRAPFRFTRQPVCHCRSCGLDARALLPPVLNRFVLAALFRARLLAVLAICTDRTHMPSFDSSLVGSLTDCSFIGNRHRIGIPTALGLRAARTFPTGRPPNPRAPSPFERRVSIHAAES